MKLKNTIYLLFALLSMINLTACGKKSHFEGYKNLAEKRWIVDSAAVFQFEVAEDTKSYQIYYNIRNTISYPYYNLYLNYELLDASGKVVVAQRTENNLLNPKTGEPYGKGIGDLYAHEFVALQNFKFPKKGSYTLKLKQDMRLDTLPEIVAVGVRVVENK
jgi:gliding motility-associated lipoprotein GldH